MAFEDFIQFLQRVQPMLGARPAPSLMGSQNPLATPAVMAPASAQAQQVSPASPAVGSEPLGMGSGGGMSLLNTYGLQSGMVNPASGPTFNTAGVAPYAAPGLQSGTVSPLPGVMPRPLPPPPAPSAPSGSPISPGGTTMDQIFSGGNEGGDGGDTGDSGYGGDVDVGDFGGPNDEMADYGDDFGDDYGDDYGDDMGDDDMGGDDDAGGDDDGGEGDGGDGDGGDGGDE